MLESLTVYSKGGLILYQHRSDPSLVKADDSASHTRAAINSVQALVKKKTNTLGGDEAGFHIKDGLTFVWKEASSSSSSNSSAEHHHQEWIVMALYPDILFEGPRAYLKAWAENLVSRTCDEYDRYWVSYYDSKGRSGQSGSFRPDPSGFDARFHALLLESKTSKPPEAKAHAPRSKPPSGDTGTSSAIRKDGSKEQRHWIGSAKVNEKTLAELDQSNPTESAPTAESEEYRLQEARQQYLPTQEELQQNDTTNGKSMSESSSWWGGTMTNLWQNLSMNKVLSKEDLAQPMERMRQLLMEKNVASSIAAKLCSTVENELVGKKLNSLYRVQTAVQQGLDKAIHGVLEPSIHVDLLRQVLTKKETGSGWFGGGGNKRRPFLICVLGINGIGKTTTVAKLAYYFQSHGCKVLLVAGDTFRSGAVEQLKTHAQCLECDIYAQGYSKDPAAVATAALSHANQPTQPQYDVVLIDTAGRMQNNAPLMAALTKLVQAVSMDCTLLVAEALVGHDALSQYEMFHRAVRRIDGLILTKYDTVGTKVGAALTLTHETSTPIVFLGTGQKYHHLQSLNVNSVIASLFAS